MRWCCVVRPSLYSLVSSSPVRAFLLAAMRSSRRSRAALVFCRLASISSLRTFSLCFSALALWIWSKGGPISACGPSPDGTSADQRMRTAYVLDQRTLVLERVTLAQVVELVVEVLVNLAAVSVLAKQATEHPETTHPKDGTVPPTGSTSSSCRQCAPMSVVPNSSR